MATATKKLEAEREEIRDQAVTILKEAVESAEAIADLRSDESRHQALVAESSAEEAMTRLRILLDGWPVLPIWTTASKVRELREGGRESALVVFDPETYEYIGLAESEEAVPQGAASLFLGRPRTQSLRERQEESQLPVRQRTRLIEIELAREAHALTREGGES